MKKVLIVDDTKNIRTLLMTCLELEGYQAATAVDGRQALSLMNSELFDLVFLDIKLPELSGTEVLRQIRASGNQIPVIIMTAFGTVKNAVECTKLGAVAYLQKPFTAEKIRQVLGEIQVLLEQDRDHSDFYLDEANVLLEQGNPDKAFLLLKQALAVNPTRKEVYSMLAKIYKALGNNQEAARFETIARQFGDE